MKTISFKISKTDRRDYPINVQVLRNNIYCGEGRFCKTNNEAEKYVNGFKYPERVKDSRTIYYICKILIN